MKIGIYGAGKCGMYVLKEIKNCECAGVDICVFIDNKKNKVHENIDNIPIVDIDEFISDYSEKVDSVLIAVYDNRVMQEMVVSLLNKNYKNILLLPNGLEKSRLPILNKNGGGWFMSYIRPMADLKPTLPYIEYHVSDFCNLKCKRCGHFSNRITEKKFPDINVFRMTLKALAEKFENIEMFRLMGGEPFCNPDLELFIYAVKEYFPYSDIRIVSNGLLLPKISKRVFQVIRECSATIDITQYLPTSQIVEEILQVAFENGVKVNLSEKITKFAKAIGSVYGNNYEQTYLECSSKGCHFLRNNYLYCCGAVILCYENRDFLEVDIKEELVQNYSFDLLNGKENGWEMLRKLQTPFEFCGYCTKRHWFDWELSKNNISKEDWIVNEDEE